MRNREETLRLCGRQNAVRRLNFEPFRFFFFLSTLVFFQQPFDAHFKKRLVYIEQHAAWAIKVHVANDGVALVEAKEQLRVARFFRRSVSSQQPFGVHCRDPFCCNATRIVKEGERGL